MRPVCRKRASPLAADGGAYTYNAAGCVTRIERAGKPTLDLTWNGLYQLVSVATNGVFAESYAYDALGRRVRSDADTFVYDDYLNVGTTVWDPTEPIATRPLVWLVETKPAYYFHDGNKNVTDVVAESEAARYSSSGDGNGYKIHWNCGKHGRASTCRGGLSAQWPSGLPSHGNLAKVPPNIRKCLKGTRWELKELPVSIPASKPNCCRRSVIYTAEPSDGGTLVGTPEMATVSLCLGTFMVVIAIVLLPVGI